MISVIDKYILYSITYFMISKIEAQQKTIVFGIVYFNIFCFWKCKLKLACRVKNSKRNLIEKQK